MGMPLSLHDTGADGPHRQSDTHQAEPWSTRRHWPVRVVTGIGAVLIAGLPSIALANPPRPSWHPGPPWAPLACRSEEVCQISNLFWIMMILSGIIFFGVTAALILSIVRFTAKPNAPEPTQVFGNRTVELIWTIIPTLILAFAFIATVKTMNNINTAHGSKAPLNIYAIGHQWWWEFNYPGHTPVDTANEVHVPTGTYIHFHVQSYDVIHSFWTPQLDRQIDANPGQDNAVFVKLDKPGIYGGDCYEYCGAEHAYMKFRMIVQSPSQFDTWLKHEQRAGTTPSASTIAAGKKVFLHNTCVNCHAVTGTSAGGAVGPNLTHVGSRWTIGAGAAPMSEADLATWIHNPGVYKPSVNMPGYPFMSNKDLHALAAYLFSLK
ncbi:MAG: cytochrome c oxidase subunit II [Chloroflexota bacterium]